MHKYRNFDLKNIFQTSLLFYAKKDTSNTNLAWDIVSKNSCSNAYTNLNRIDEVFTSLNFFALKRTLGKVSYHLLSHQVILALFLQNVSFSPFDPKSKEKSGKYAKELLSHYGVIDDVKDEIERIILASGRWLPPIETESHGIRTIHDLRNAKLAYRYEDFFNNTLKVRAEYSCLDNKDFFRIQLKLFRFLRNLDHLFSFPTFELALDKKARSNIKKYEEYVKAIYYKYLENNPEELDNYLGIDNKALKSKPKEIECKKASGYNLEDIIQDKYTSNTYKIIKLLANSVQVSVINKKNTCEPWGFIPNGILYSTRFGKIYKSEMPSIHSY